MTELTLTHKEKISKSLKQYYKENPDKILKGDKHSKKVGISTKSGKKIESILHCSRRTMTKILKRLGISCCVCGWKEGTIDIHHILGKKVIDPDDHKNLAPLCPNHHRLLHEKKLAKEQVKSLYEILPENWQDYYYG